MLIAASDLKAKHKKYVLTSWLAQGKLEPPVIVRGEGVYIYDAEGKRYLDLTSGLVAVNLGHGHPTVTQAIKEQVDRLCFSPPAWFNDQRAELGEALVGISPWGPDDARVFFTTSGAQANEDAIKFARTVTGRPKVMTAYRSFHGSGPGAGTLTGENRRWNNGPEMAGVVRFFNPFPYRSPFFTRDPKEETQRALEHVAGVIAAEGADRIAALLIEPVIGSNGVIVPPDGYLAGLRALCSKHGILLIFDEVMTGYGRTGAAFASQRFNVTPDMLTFAKGITSGYIPLGGVLMRESIASYFDTNPLVSGHTYSGHPVAMAAGVATLRAYREGDLFERGLQIEGWLRIKLGALKDRHPVIGEVRGVGAFFALEFVKDRETREPLIEWQGAGMGVMQTFFNALPQAGIYALGRYNVMHCTPPLTIEESELDEAMAGLDIAIGKLEAAL